MMLLTLVKLLVPVSGIRIALGRALDFLACSCWIYCSNTTHRILGGTRIHVRGLSEVKVKRWCLLISNHQTWVDILVIIRIFFGKVPPYKFFIKKELLWLPMVGVALWALDYPVMRRYSKEYLAKNPHLRGKDLEATRRACDKFKARPVAVMNFVEGTRLTPEKQKAQNSPYRHLLKPRAGGTALVLYAMGDVLEQIIDITIVYPDGPPGLWEYFCGGTREIFADVRRLDVTPDLIGSYDKEPAYKSRVQEWLNSLWKEKDERIERCLENLHSERAADEGSREENIRSRH